MTYRIKVTTPKDSAWWHSEDGTWKATTYESRDIAERVCERLNALDLPFTYTVTEIEERVA